jgi:hypothetical protein
MRPLPRTARLSTISQRPSPFIRLPAELVNYVLQLAAASSRHCSLDICLVASWARHLALPYLFHTIVIDTVTSFGVRKYIADSPCMPANTNLLAGSSVKGAWIGGTGLEQYDQILAVFEACENITQLALRARDLDLLLRCSSPGIPLYGFRKRISPRAMARNHDLHLTLFGAHWSPSNWLRTYYKPDPTRRSPIFDRVTHMRLTCIGFYKSSIILDDFSRLSHLSVPYCLGGGHKAKHLQYFLDLKSLKMLVIAVAEDVIKQGHWKRLQKWVRDIRETDGRVYLVPCSSTLRDEWEKESRGGECIWDRAVRYTNEWECQTSGRCTIITFIFLSSPVLTMFCYLESSRKTAPKPNVRPNICSWCC